MIIKEKGGDKVEIRYGEEIFPKRRERLIRKITIIHHDDLDGVSSAGLVYGYLKEKRYGNIDFIKYNYQGNLKEEIEKRKNLLIGKTRAIIVDLSITEEELKEVIEEYDEVIWIDHHGTSVDIVERYKDKLYAVLIDTNRSACLIVNELLEEELKERYKKEEVTEIGRIVSAYDTWNKTDIDMYLNGSYLNRYFFDSGNITPEDSIWYKFIEDEESLYEILAYGKQMQRIHKLKNKLIYESNCIYESEYKGIKMQALMSRGNSEMFESDEEYSKKINILIRYSESRPDIIKISAYTELENIDLGKILRDTLNGGGHPKAAGASIEENKLRGEEGLELDINYSIKHEIRYNEKIGETFKKISRIIYAELNK